MGTVGIFDSGLGGLSVVRAIAQRLPTLSLVYFGDTARFPYGTKSAEIVARYASENAAFLVAQGAGAIVIACNTATSVALTHLQKNCSVPVYGVIEPAAIQATRVSRFGRIGVIGTARTVATKSYSQAIHRIRPEASVTELATPLLVSAIEDGCPSEEILRLLVREYLRPLSHVDTLLLGCTHYALIEPLIQDVVGNDVVIIDPALCCAEVMAQAMLCPSADKPTYTFFASDDPTRFKAVGEMFLQRPIEAVRVHQLLGGERH